MSTATASYTSSNHHLPSSSPSSRYEMEPESYLFEYAKSMHNHTKKQMEAATKSARRRSPHSDGTNSHPSLVQDSSISSTESTNSNSMS